STSRERKRERNRPGTFCPSRRELSTAELNLRTETVTPVPGITPSAKPSLKCEEICRSVAV
ncbi:MAG: hypothetical protein WAW24_09535, partial [Bacteroidales bacterium]